MMNVAMYELKNNDFDAFRVLVTDTISSIWDKFLTECESIAEECSEEGLPSHGSTYDLRCESLYERAYKEDIEYWESLLD